MNAVKKRQKLKSKQVFLFKNATGGDQVGKSTSTTITTVATTSIVC